MTEPANNPVPPPPPPPPPAPPRQDCTPAPEQDASLREELAKARCSNRTLKVVAWGLLALFLLAAAGGYIVYRKVTELAEPFTQMFQAFPPPQALPGVPGQAGALPSTSAASSLSMISSGGSMFTQAENPIAAADEEKAEQLLAALYKYGDRPIAKQFIADMQRNPDLAEAFKASKGGNPLAVISYIHNAKGMEEVVLKYAMNPEFMALMMEVMNDPEVQPYIRGMKMPAGLPMPPKSPPQPDRQARKKAPPPVDSE